MRGRPDEKLTFTYERTGRRLRVKAFYYQGEALVATSAPWYVDMVDESGYERSIADLMDVRRELCNRAKLFADQFTLF